MASNAAANLHESFGADDVASASKFKSVSEAVVRSRSGDGSKPIIAAAFCWLGCVGLIVSATAGEDRTAARPVANQPPPPPTACSDSTDEPVHNYWYVGVTMSCCACLANSFGYNLVRFAHVKVEKLKAEGHTGAKATHLPVFYVGWALSIVICAGLDTLALAFTAPELLGPLSGVTLVLNIWVAQLINKESVYALDGAVTVLILAGVVLTVSSGPTDSLARVDSDFLWKHLLRPTFLIYEFIMYSTAAVVKHWCNLVYGDGSEASIAAGRVAHPRISNYSMVLYPWLGAIFTAHMNVWMATFLRYRGSSGVCNGVDPSCAEVPRCGSDDEYKHLCISAENDGARCDYVSGSNRFLEPGPYLILIALVLSVTIQLRAINSGLMTEGALTFVPIKSALNVAQFFVLSSGSHIMRVMVADIVGLCTVIVGVLLILLRPVTPNNGQNISGTDLGVGGLEVGVRSIEENGVVVADDRPNELRAS